LLRFCAPRRGADLKHPDSEKPEGRPDREAERRRAWALAFNLGWVLVASIGICGYLGYLADRFWGTGPWLMVVGFSVGVVVGLYQFIKTVLRTRP
jgi:F0F1-type ATP synthase assembly protein I